MLRRLRRKSALVEGGFTEGRGVDRKVRTFRKRGRDQCAVDTAAQQQRYRHVADELVADHARPQQVESVKRLVEVGDLGAPLRLPEFLDAPAVAVGDEKAARRHRDDPIDQAARRPGKTLRKETVQALRRKLSRLVIERQQRLDLAGEAQRASDKGKVQRFDPDGIAREDQALIGLVPQGHRIDALEFEECIAPPLPVGGCDHFGIASGVKLRSRRLRELRADVEVIVQFAVIGDGDFRLRVDHRLCAGR